jgi:hypothetical protein
MVGLIVGGIILLLIVVALITCYVYREDIMKMGAATAIRGLQTQITENAPEGVDTTRFNEMTEAFVARVNEDELDAEKYAAFFGVVQDLMSKQEFTAEDVRAVEDAMIQYYPELEEYRQALPGDGDEALMDTLEAVEDTLTSP